MPDENVLREFFSKSSRPIEIVDFAGNIRTFELSGFVTVGYTIVANEVTDSMHGYEFEATSYSSPQEAFASLVHKIRVSLATRHLAPNNLPSLLTHSCVGRVGSGGVIVDGQFISWQQFAEMAQAYEGWEFALKFGDT